MLVRVFIVLCTLLLASCGADDKSALKTAAVAEPERKSEPAAELHTSPASDRSGVLVTVNGSPITEDDFDYAIGRISAGTVLPLGAKVEQKVLNTLVMSRAIAIEAQPALGRDVLQAIEAQVRSVREQLLTKHYLAQRNPPSPITPEAMKKFYNENLVLFGGKDIPTYEFLELQPPLPSQSELNEYLSDLTTSNDWSMLASSLQEKGLTARTFTSRSDDKLLNDRLRQLAEQHTSQSTSASSTIYRGALFYVKAAGSVKGSAMPLAQVKQKVIQALAAKNIRNALESLSNELLEEANIKFTNNNPSDI